MYKQTMNVAKGIGMGVLAGVTVAAISTKAMAGGHRKARHRKNIAGKALHTVGHLIADVEKLLRCRLETARRELRRYIERNAFYFTDLPLNYTTCLPKKKQTGCALSVHFWY